MRRTTMRRTAAIGLTTIALIGASCGDDDSSTTASESTASTSEPATTETPATTEAAASTEAPAPTDAPASTEAPAPTDAPVTPPEGSSLPTTPIVAPLSQSYDFLQGSPDPALLPAQLGEVEAHWYRAGDVLAVVYVGLDATVDACPGNSAFVPTGFDFVSNAELPNGSCPDFPTLIENTASQGVQICDGQVGYLTLIPADTIGQVFASIEKPVPDVVGVGLTGSTLLDDPSAVPEIDPTSLAC